MTLSGEERGLRDRGARHPFPSTLPGSASSKEADGGVAAGATKTDRLSASVSASGKVRRVHHAHGHRTANLLKGGNRSPLPALAGLQKASMATRLILAPWFFSGQGRSGGTYEGLPVSWLGRPAVLGSTIRINCGTGAAVGTAKGPNLRDLLQIGRPRNAPENPRVAGSIPALWDVRSRR